MDVALQVEVVAGWDGSLWSLFYLGLVCSVKCSQNPEGGVGCLTYARIFWRIFPQCSEGPPKWLSSKKIIDSPNSGNARILGTFSSANQALEHCSAVLINLLAQRLWDYRSESSKRMFKDKPPFCHKYAHKPWPGFICSQINKRNRDLSNFSFVTFRENGRLEWKDPGFPGGQKYFFR